jgi:Domain of unknown function (DUF4251)
MKKSIFNMGRVSMTLGFCLITFNSHSQDVKLSKQELKEAKRAEMAANYMSLDTVLERKNFVLEADFLQNQNGIRTKVTSILNFIKVDSDHAVLQTGDGNYVGSNSVGGVTAEGRIDHWKIVRDSIKLRYFLQFSIFTDIGIYDVAMTIYADNVAQAAITGIKRGRLFLDGHLKINYNSIIYKGINTI